MKTIHIDSTGELPHVAREIIASLDGRNVVAFYGPMGAGKTTLIKEIAAHLGVADQVTSPTFALVNQYATGAGGTVFHFDFYRIDKIAEAYDMGCEEYFDSGHLCLVEWPEKITGLLPDDTLTVTIATDPSNATARTVTIG